MQDARSVFVWTRTLPGGRVELVLEDVDDDAVRFSKVYDGLLFLSMDAQSLDLLEASPETSGNAPRYRLKRSGCVHPDLMRMRFVAAPAAEQKG